MAKRIDTSGYYVARKENNFLGPKQRRFTRFQLFEWSEEHSALIFVGTGIARGHNASNYACVKAWLAKS